MGATHKASVWVDGKRYAALVKRMERLGIPEALLGSLIIVMCESTPDYLIGLWSHAAQCTEDCSVREILEGGLNGLSQTFREAVHLLDNLSTETDVRFAFEINLRVSLKDKRSARSNGH